MAPAQFQSRVTSLTQQGQFGRVVSGLICLAEQDPRGDWLLQTTLAILQLAQISRGHPRAPLLGLFASPAVFRSLHNLNRGIFNASFSHLDQEHTVTPSDLYAAGRCFSLGMLEWPEQPARAAIVGMVQAGGIGRLTLLIEHHLANLPRDDFERALAVLDRLETGVRAHQRRRKTGDPVLPVAPLESTQRATRRLLKNPSKRKAVQQLDDFMRFFLPDSLQAFFQPNAYAKILTDYLLGRGGGEEGSCVPSGILLGHLACLAGFATEFLQQIGHLNVYDKATGFVVDVCPTQYVYSFMEDARWQGTFGPAQSPTSSHAAISAILGNIAVSLDPKNAGDKERFRAASVSLFPDNAQGWLSLAALRGKEEVPEKAALERALAINPSYAQAHACMAVIHNREGNNGKAIESLEKALKLAAEQAERRFPMVGTIHLAEPLDSDFEFQIYQNLASLYLKEGRGDQISVFLIRESQRPCFPPARRARPLFLLWGYALQDERLSEALSYWDQAVAINPEVILEVVHNLRHNETEREFYVMFAKHFYDRLKPHMPELDERLAAHEPDRAS